MTEAPPAGTAPPRFRDPADGEIAVLVDRCLDAGRTASVLLAGTDRGLAEELVAGAIAIARDYAAAGAGPAAGDQAGHRAVTERRLAAALEAIRGHVDAAGQRRVRQRYVEGALLGILVVLAAAGVARLGLVYVIGPTVPGTSYMPTVLVAGAFGGLVGVLLRLARGSLRIHPGARDAAIRLAGLVRPILGAVVAAALVVLMIGGLVPLPIPESNDVRPFFVVGLAFLAGFLERFFGEVLAADR